MLDTLWAFVRNAAAAGVAQLVEHQLAMLDVAGSNPVSRSTQTPVSMTGVFRCVHGLAINKRSPLPCGLHGKHRPK